MRRPTFISDPEDGRVAPYRDLRDRDGVLGRRGFVAEGAVVLEKAIARGLYPFSSVLVSSRLFDRLSPRLEGLAPEVELYVAPQEVLDRICGFPAHRGVFAYGARPALPSAADLLRDLAPDALVVCSLGVNDAENMGALFRNAAAFGAAAVILDSTSTDPLHRRAIRVSVGAALLTPFARLGPAEDLLDLLEACGVSAVALSPAGALALPALRAASPTAVLVGAEGPGLPAQVLARTRSVRIPMADGFDSLNVATALAIALHHLRSAAPATWPPGPGS